MSEEKIFTPEIVEATPFPGQDVPVVTQTQSNPAGTYTPTTTPAKSFPTRKIATELIGQAINTRSRNILQEFDLVGSGGFQVGKYENGVSGDLRITPNGITARDTAGLSTFAIDGTTGGAVFRGEVQAGAFISGLVVVGDNSVVIDGETRRLVFYDENGIPVIVIGNA